MKNEKQEKKGTEVLKSFQTLLNWNVNKIWLSSF